MRLLISLAAVMLAVASAASGQSPERPFHDGARVYVDGKLSEASEIVAGGLAEFPTDPKLLALNALIEQEKERQQQSGEGNSEQQEQEQNQEQESQQNQSGNEEDPSQEESGEGEQKQEEEQQGQGEPEPQEPSDEQQPEDREQQSVEAGENQDQLSRAQAIRILQALQNEEEELLREVQKIKGRPRRVEKDW
jgi:hypothetical protein